MTETFLQDARLINRKTPAAATVTGYPSAE